MSPDLLLPVTPLFRHRLQLVDLALELADVAELAVDGREAHVRDLVHAAQLFHDARADVGRLHLPIRPILQLRLDPIGDPLELLHADRALLTCAEQTADQLLPLKRLGTAVLLDDAVLDLFDVLAARVSLAARKTLPASADAVAFLALARVHVTVAVVSAEGTFHLTTPTPSVGGRFARSRIPPKLSPSRAMKNSPRGVTGTNEIACRTMAAPTAVVAGTPRNVTTATLYIA